MQTRVRHGSLRRIALLLAACCCLPLLAGCPKTGSSGSGRPGGLPSGARLVLLVVGDPSLAEAIERLQSEWNALSGSDFVVAQWSQQELESAATIAADAVICPSCQVAEVAAKSGLAPVPKNLLKEEEGVWPGIFSLLRVREAVWGDTTVGVPFGSPVFVVYYRADLLEKLGRKPPQTWAEYHELATLLADRSKLGEAAPAEGLPWYGAVQPLGPGWAGTVLLARAAPYVSHRENYSTLFRVDDMGPLIDGPPFVRAMEQLVADASLGPPEQLTWDPAAARAAFWQGRCGMALSWPTAAKTAVPAAESPAKLDQSEPPASGIRVGLAELPGSPESYDIGEKAWETRQADDDPRVPLLGAAGRTGLVLASSQSPDAAFRLLFWLSDEQAREVCTASPATTLFRRSHLASPRDWVEPQMPSATATQYAELTARTLSRPGWMYALRIPGRLRYLAALDEAVHRAVRGEATCEQSLRQAANEWRKITDQLGSDAQRRAYWNGLGIE